MATYFNKYYFIVRDRHTVNPADWRVDIMDSEGAVPTEPFLIQPSGDPLITERIETDDNKANFIIGRQITLAYEYTGAANDPLPEEFFESHERRWRVEVRKNGILDGIYYVRPDFSQRTLKYPPVTITLKAVDGLSYAKAVPFNVYDGSGLLFYDKISTYEALMARALSKILDAGTPINVLCSLLPDNIEGGKRLLNGTFIHTDIFYDFVKGASTVHEVLTAFCRAFYARCFIAQNQVWFVRMQDLTGAVATVEQYTDENTVTDVNVPGFIRSAGSDPALYDACLIDDDPEIIMASATKKAEFEADYQGINILQNFAWDGFTGTDFPEWVRATVNGTPPAGRAGIGIPDDPYRLVLPYTTAFNHWINQGFFVGSPTIIVNTGEILDIEIKYRFNNTKSFRMIIYAQAEQSGNFVAFVMDQSGKWIRDLGVIDEENVFTVTRAGKKQEGSLRIKTDPLPRAMLGTTAFPEAMKLSVSFYYPTEISEHNDGPIPQSVQIYPPKIGAIAAASKGRHLTATNQADFSRVIDEPDKFTFIDTGDDGVSNTIFTGAAKVPVTRWVSAKPGIAGDDIERHMVRAHIDQYRRSVTTVELPLYSNALEYYNPIEFVAITGKRFMQMRDTYNNLTCTHNLSVIEIFEEGSAGVDIMEYDIEDEREE